MIKFVCFYLCVFTVSGFLYDNPCDVFPKYSGGIPSYNNFTTTVNVPAKCKNGTFRWDYPKGHAMLHFQNMHGMEMKICIKDSLGGTFFNVTDKATNERLGPFDYETYACLQPTSEREVVLQVDAPLDLRYMGEFEYRIYK
ncbi:uncharacterized protein LOC132750200 [Ruditapes philippinarum]|uniref:uncharacterized protein LOC132750200 n=1 Tax=Ruditapes philippinarum TaxID=129788 RepID=UPI00295BFD9E|nr:uncharacterized protein LOC132750200 [Ruditapes philippinarum]